MRTSILAFIAFFIMTSASLADSNVYITQSGAALDLDITMMEMELLLVQQMIEHCLLVTI